LYGPTRSRTSRKIDPAVAKSAALPRNERYVGLRDRTAQRVRTRHDSGFGHGCPADIGGRDRIHFLMKCSSVDASRGRRLS
jgi:hypothetical protein